MSACEECWTEASRKVLLLGGSVVDRYRDELSAHPEHGEALERRHPVKTLRTTDDFEEQPLGTIVRCHDVEGIGLNIAERKLAGWVYVGSSLEFPSSALSHDEVPYDVIYAPEVVTDER